MLNTLTTEILSPINNFKLSIGFDVLTRISSLNYLRTFALAAKYLSFKVTAKQLNISATAVSHQIKALEQQLSVNLFERKVRSISLTFAGKELAKCCLHHLKEIDYVLSNLAKEKNDICISCCQSFAALWLTPKSNLFSEKFPDDKLTILASDSLVDVDQEKQLDIAIRYGTNHDVDNEKRLFNETISLYKSTQHPHVIKNIAKSKLTLFVTHWPDDNVLANINWQQHIDMAKFDIKTFPQEFFVLQAIMTGQGVGLLSDVLATSAVEQGWITPTDIVTPFTGYSYWLRVSRERSSSLRVQQATQWVVHEFNKLL